MGKIKGSSMVYLNKLLAGLTPAAQAQVASTLGPPRTALLRSALASTWYEVSEISPIIEALAKAGFPGDKQGLYKVGHGMARDHLTGIYRLFVMVASVDYVFGRAAALWRQYHDSGVATAERGQEPGSGTFIVSERPDLSPVFREFLSGYIAGTLELAGAKDTRVTHDGRDPQHWRWEFAWH